VTHKYLYLVYFVLKSAMQDQCSTIELRIDSWITHCYNEWDNRYACTTSISPAIVQLQRGPCSSYAYSFIGLLPRKACETSQTAQTPVKTANVVKLDATAPPALFMRHNNTCCTGRRAAVSYNMPFSPPHPPHRAHPPPTRSAYLALGLVWVPWQPV